MKFSFNKLFRFASVIFILLCSLGIWYFAIINWNTPTQENDFSLAWSLIVIGFIPASIAGIYVYSHRKDFKSNRLKYFFYLDPEEIKENTRLKAIPKLTEKEQEELARKKEEEQNIDKERKRSGIEKYKMKQFSGKWLVIPFLISLGAFIYGVYEFYQYSKTDVFNWTGIIIAAVLAFLPMGITSTDEGWEERLRYKYKIKNENSNYKVYDYEDDYAYTDSVFEFSIYQLAKFYSYIVSVFGCVALVIGIFAWIANISISPTTVIIILLIVIIIILVNKR